MQIIINSHPVPLDAVTVTQMERRIHFALGRFGNAINRVSVRLMAMNGVKGGANKQCLIVVKLQKGSKILIQGKGVDNDSLLNHCADRISRAVARATRAAVSI
ncbi:MAG: hypothetical protein PF442_08975 [Desulfobulbaceae bacterium]|jgi:putative sigma-54 modulation protein|nr:hypothetical protein [Desulfobulbaceae bacterium]